jgi:hypothetical protein
VLNTSLGVLCPRKPRYAEGRPPRRVAQFCLAG